MSIRIMPTNIQEVPYILRGKSLADPIAILRRLYRRRSYLDRAIHSLERLNCTQKRRSSLPLWHRDSGSAAPAGGAPRQVPASIPRKPFVVARPTQPTNIDGGLVA